MQAPGGEQPHPMPTLTYKQPLFRTRVCWTGSKNTVLQTTDFWCSLLLFNLLLKPLLDVALI